MKTTQLHCIISGRVQAVAFRDFVKNIAQEMDIAGVVANLPDGSLEVVAQGKYEVLKIFAEHLRTGPPGAVVTGFYDEWNDEPEERFEGFRVV